MTISTKRKFRKGSGREKLRNRMHNRTRRHGNFRQTLIDYAFQCCLCASVEQLEFHAPNGHDGPGSNRIGWSRGRERNDADRIVFCPNCHSNTHGGDQMRFIGMHLVDPSQLLDDIVAEIVYWGGFGKWVKAFKLDVSANRFGNKLPENGREERSLFAINLLRYSIEEYEPPCC